MVINTIDADKALKLLMDGNSRFVRNHLRRPHSDDKRRHSLEDGQAPFAIILTCSDSRLLPDLIFDQGLGDLFVIRIAGNVVKDKVLGSIEYAVQHLGTKLVLVLGHESCGAIIAALEPSQNEGHIDSILDAIRPAVHIARHQQGNLLENAIKNNVLMVTEQIKDSMPVLNRAIKNDGVKIVSAYYCLGSGEVQLF